MAGEVITQSNQVTNGCSNNCSVPENVEVHVSTKRGNVTNFDLKRFKKDITIGDLKWRLEIITGRSKTNMLVTLLNNDHKDICKLSDDNSTLSSYPVATGMVLLVEDPTFVEIDENTANRFQLTDEEYDKRKGTLKDFLLRNKIGKYDPKFANKISENEIEEEKMKQLSTKDEEMFQSIDVGQRCKVNTPDQPIRYGEVMFKGTVEFQKGLWIGVKYDEPAGKNDGTVNGVKYFDVPPKYGAFVRPCYIETGDFPEICELDSDNEF